MRERGTGAFERPIPARRFLPDIVRLSRVHNAARSRQIHERRSVYAFAPSAEIVEGSLRISRAPGIVSRHGDGLVGRARPGDRAVVGHKIQKLRAVHPVGHVVGHVSIHALIAFPLILHDERPDSVGAVLPVKGHVHLESPPRRDRNVAEYFYVVGFRRFSGSVEMHDRAGRRDGLKRQRGGGSHFLTFPLFHFPALPLSPVPEHGQVDMLNADVPGDVDAGVPGAADGYGDAAMLPALGTG